MTQEEKGSCDANGASPLRTIRFKPISRPRKTGHLRPLKTIHILPPPHRREEPVRPLKTIRVVPPPRPGDPRLV